MKQKAITLLLASSLAFSYSFGQVVLQDSFSYHGASQQPTDLGGGVFGYEIDTTGFSAAGNGKLALSYSTKSENDIAGNGDIGGDPFGNILFGGVALAEALTVVDSGRGTAGIWYLDNVGSDGILRLEVDQSFGKGLTDFGVGIYALDGLKSGVQDTAFGTSNDSDSTVTVTTSSGFVVQEAVRNNQSLSADGTDDFATLYNFSSNSYRGLQQHQVTTAAGDYFAPTNNTNSRLVMGGAFEAVPEPSAFALLAGMFGLTWVMLRRRS